MYMYSLHVELQIFTYMYSRRVQSYRSWRTTSSRCTQVDLFSNFYAYDGKIRGIVLLKFLAPVKQSIPPGKISCP